MQHGNQNIFVSYTRRYQCFEDKAFLRGRQCYERAPLCGYINKPSFSIVIIIFLSIIYILYITIQLHTWLSITDMSGTWTLFII
jgi:hypothetical protein